MNNDAFLKEAKSDTLMKPKLIDAADLVNLKPMTDKIEPKPRFHKGKKGIAPYTKKDHEKFLKRMMNTQMTTLKELRLLAKEK